VGVDSGLSALELSLRAFGIGPGDEVIVPANTFIATAAAVTFAGAEPVLVDVDPETYNIDVARIEAAITPRTRAIIPVHLYGLPADMDPIMDLAERHGLVVIEDACQAHGARYKGRPVGSLGHAAAFSFYPTKNLGGAGDGGMVTTDDAEIAEIVRAMRNVGQRRKYYHELPPLNRRLDTLQAAILRVKLRRLDSWITARRNCAALYDELLAPGPEYPATGNGLIAPRVDPDSMHVYHLYVVRVPDRDALKAFLDERGVGTGIHYPVPIYRQPFYAQNGFRAADFPVTEQLVGEILSLPMFPEMTAEQAVYVATQVRQGLTGLAAASRQALQPYRAGG
jgi:dTDP-4-amino-4,6-dideoxygalactose transaminase